MNSAYRCPLCQSPLQPNPQGFGCEHNHQFDLAKEGYVNLLPVQHKKSKNPGDNQHMVQARRAFLASGYYQFLQTQLLTTISALIPTNATKTTILDCGCGEGYYTNQIAQTINNAEVYGIDIAKTAIRYGAKRGPQTHFAVASSHALPFAEQSIDILFKVFAPMAANEIQRVLKPLGYFVSVVPGPWHLQQLRQYIYQQVKPHQQELCPPGFCLQNTQNIQQQLILEQSADIEHLCKMTPFTWKISEKTLKELLSLDKLTITFDFTINVYQLDNRQ